jgi:hypothetical protein
MVFVLLFEKCNSTRLSMSYECPLIQLKTMTPSYKNGETKRALKFLQKFLLFAIDMAIEI